MDLLFESWNAPESRKCLERHVQPAAEQLGLKLGGWHDFRHSLTTSLRRDGVHPKVISGILGHSKVNLAMDSHDHVDAADFGQPLAAVAERLLPGCYPDRVVA